MKIFTRMLHIPVMLLISAYSSIFPRFCWHCFHLLSVRWKFRKKQVNVFLSILHCIWCAMFTGAWNEFFVYILGWTEWCIGYGQYRLRHIKISLQSTVKWIFFENPKYPNVFHFNRNSFRANHSLKIIW